MRWCFPIWGTFGGISLHRTGRKNLNKGFSKGYSIPAAPPNPVLVQTILDHSEPVIHMGFFVLRFAFLLVCGGLDMA